MNCVKSLQSSLLGGAALIVIATSPADAISVVGMANPFLAGQPAPTGCCSGDAVPAQSPVLALSGALGGSVLTFSATGGARNEPGSPASSPDGLGTIFDMSLDYGTGISGPLAVSLSGLVGVFVGSGVPSGPVPAQRNDGMTFASISPGLNQIFWIGDGLTGTGSGSVQSFTAPTGATRLFLGTADGFGWANNIGTIEVTINGAPVGETPVPAALPLFATGLGALGLVAYRRRKRAA
jgi:hypothetical protein